MEYNLDKFKQGLDELGITLGDIQMNQFLQYYELLVEWNSFMNLTGITEFEDVVTRHFLDSLALVKGCDLKKINRMIDIGTGAGFPGIPLKIAFPNMQVVLLDSLNKRIKFLEEVISVTGLKNINTIHGRAEDFAKQEQYREKFDLCVSRAVANLSTLSEYCLPYVSVKGQFISYKSGKVEQELKDSARAIEVLGGEIRETIYFPLADTDMERSLVIVEKVKKTQKKYPRRAGLPTKEPI